ncbi:MAG: ion transporter [Spirochaetaceae bacterium]|nr:ion transporter [Spirochaetaceae bacterium]
METKSKKRIYEIVDVAASDDRLSRIYDFVGAAAILINLICNILDTFATVHTKFGRLFDGIEIIVVCFFLVDYALRIYVADLHFEKSSSELKAKLSYIFSLSGIIDLLSFLPFFLPFFFPHGIETFRMFRIIRIFRLFRINTYYDSVSVITGVLKEKKTQLMSSVFILFVLVMAGSLCLYSIEHQAQPDVFDNAFSGVWWAVSTLLTVGYGDIYPITTLGKFFSILLTFTGVLLVAIPTGILSAGFVEEYTRMKRTADYIDESKMSFIRVCLKKGDDWIGKTVDTLQFPHDMVLAAIQSENQTIVPYKEYEFKEKDVILFAAAPFQDDIAIDLKKVRVGSHSSWVNKRIKDLTLGDTTCIVLIERNGRPLIPTVSTRIREKDTIILFTSERFVGEELVVENQ